MISPRITAPFPNEVDPHMIQLAQDGIPGPGSFFPPLTNSAYYPEDSVAPTVSSTSLGFPANSASVVTSINASSPTFGNASQLWGSTTKLEICSIGNGATDQGLISSLIELYKNCEELPQRYRLDPTPGADQISYEQAQLLRKFDKYSQGCLANICHQDQLLRLTVLHAAMYLATVAIQHKVHDEKQNQSRPRLWEALPRGNHARKELGHVLYDLDHHRPDRV